MNIIKPVKLKIGDTIGFLATSGDIENSDRVLLAVNYFEKMGYKTVLSENMFSHDRYLAGNDKEKVKAIHNFFRNPDINAIICARGGYGALRIINDIDYTIIKNNPKIFCGYSDVTALSAMFLKKAGLITYSGPMICSDFGQQNTDHYTIQEFFKALTLKNIKINGKKEYKTGCAEGIFWGGNLSTLVSLCGQDFIPDEPFIFFAEDLNEPAYKIDKMFTQLMNIDKFRKNIQAIVLGDFLNVDNQEWFDELFKEISNKLNIPTVGGFQISHSTRKVTLPYGAEAVLNNKSLSFK